MATVPSGTRFIGISTNVNLTERKSAMINAETQPFTMQDIADTVGVGSQGPQGVQGPAGPIGPVGPAGLNWQGSWTSGTSYVADDAVGYAGASWFCILATSGTTTPNLDTTHWALLASQGAQGIQGVQGPTGPQGASGGSGTLQQAYNNGNTMVSGNFKTGIFDLTTGVSVENTSTLSKTTVETTKITLTKNATGLKTTNLLQAVTPTANRTIYFPDADGTVALTSDVTTKTLKTTITSAQVKQLFTTPISVLPTASVGKVNIPTNIYIKRNAGTAYTLDTNAFILLDGLNIDTNTQINPNPLTTTSNGYMNNTIYLADSVSGITSTGPYKLKAAGNNPTVGTGNLDVYVTYIEITL